MSDVSKSPTASPMQPALDVERRYPRDQRLLVADDEEVVCRLVRAFLVQHGWQVDAAESLDVADAMLEQQFYPVVLCDVHLPGNSAEFLHKWKERRPAAQVIMFTGDPTINTAREAILYGAYEYIPKPCRQEELVRVVKRAYDKFLLLREQERLQAENEAYHRQLEELADRRTEQLRQTELRYRAVFDRAVDAIFLVDADTAVICDHNIAASQLLDLKTHDIMGRAIHDFVGSQLHEALADASQPGHGEWRFERVVFVGADDRRRTAHVSAGKVELDQQHYLQIVARDITQQLELIEQNLLMENELLHEQRLAMIGHLASGVAHNINTPLMGIYGAAQLIKLKHPEVLDADSVIMQVERINDIIRNLIWKSRHEQDSSMQEIDLNQLLREELRFLEADLDYKHNVQKQFTFADDIPAILGCYRDFSQSLMNVVRNALDAMQGRDNKQLSVGTGVTDGEIRITVRDNGCGIAREDRDKIFLPFYTTKATAERASHGLVGSGLGLAATRKLLTPYSARFEVDSEIGHGTTFTICLPIAKNAPSVRGSS